MSAKVESCPPSRTAVVLAFAAVYVIWGSTYLAILYAVETLPPFLLVGVRFIVAGALLYAWSRSRGHRPEHPGQWKAALGIGVLLVASNAGVTWSEQFLSSGVAALLITTVPLWMVVLQWFDRRAARPAWVELIGLVLGFAGVGLLVGDRGLGNGRPVHLGGCAVVIIGSCCWAFGSLRSRRADLPSSPLMATSMQMLMGGAAMLLLGSVLGEWGRFHPGAVSLRSVLAMVYLILFGSIVAFTSYVWLLRVVSPAMVATYAYVNPVVAVLLGFLIANEPLTARSVLAMTIIIAAVALVTLRRKPARPRWIIRRDLQASKRRRQSRPQIDPSRHASG